MAIEKMRFIRISFKKEHLHTVLERIPKSIDFHPIEASAVIERVGGLKRVEQENPNALLERKFEEVSRTWQMQPQVEQVSERVDFSLLETQFDAWYHRVQSLEQVKQEVQTINEEYEVAKQTLRWLAKTRINLDDLFACRYLKVRFGRIPKESVEKMNYYTSHPFALEWLAKDRNYAWCMYVTPLQHEGEIDNIFSSLEFERTRIPDFIHGTPQRALEMMEEEIQANQRQVELIETRIAQLKQEAMPWFSQGYQALQAERVIASYQRYVVDLGYQYLIQGFALEHAVVQLKTALLGIAQVEDLPPNSDDRFKPPTKLKHGWFSRPFAMFVEMYGVPSYQDIDPTLFVAITYTILFGMMFADVGQGLLLCAVGWLVWKRWKQPLGAIGVRIGLSSTVFGFLFGSFFGNETLMTPLYPKDSILPIAVLDASNVMVLLGVTIAMGVIIILTSMLLNCYVEWKKKDWPSMLCSQNGIAGVVFYSGVLLYACDTLLFGWKLPWGIMSVLCFILPLILMFSKELIEHMVKKEPLFEEGVMGFFIVTFFEMFEILLSFAANTMSFLRVGGFVLSHAGMMLVVYTLAEMGSGMGSVLIIVFGNLFVMLLEGMIVGIQVLRLEFYEMFSRYFSGEGIVFTSWNHP